MLPRLVVRSDATTQIGTGHVMRCLALAQEWTIRGGDVIFASHIEGSELREIVTAAGADLCEIAKPHPDPSDLANLLDVVSQAPSAVVVDNYYFDTDYQREVKAASIATCVIRDFSDLAPICADVLLNQNVNAHEAVYGVIRPGQLLLGTQYVLLRREFLNVEPGKRGHPAMATRLLVTMGGGDPDNATGLVLKALDQVQHHLPEHQLNVKALVGPANPNRPELEAMQRDLKINLELISGANDVPGLMSGMDLAISAAGTTTWELAYLGIPTALLMTADNQAGIIGGMSTHGAALALGRLEEVTKVSLANDLGRLIQDSELRKNLSEIARTVVDGKGAARVVDAILESAEAPSR